MARLRLVRSEARFTLKRPCAAQLSRLVDAGIPAERYRDLGEDVERCNRYAYFVAPGSRLEERTTNHGPSTPDPLATGALVAVGNVDLDPDLDIWSVATAARRTSAGDDIPSCRPFHERDDVPRGFLCSLFSTSR